MKVALDTTYGITKLIKKNRQRVQNCIKSNKLSTDDNKLSSIRLLCPTRWTVRVCILESIIANFYILQKLWTWSLDNCLDTGIKAI